MAIINGTTGDDRDGATLTGTAEADEIFGLEGEDWLEGLAGNDTLDGGDGGRDVAIYENDPSGITGNLTTGIVTDGFGDTDTLIGIERIYGSAFGDTLTGGGIDNLLLYALGGDDVLTVDNSGFFSNLDGGEGNDSLTSLSGDAFFEPGSGQDTVTGSSDYGILSYWFGADESDPPTSSGVVVTFTSERDGSVFDFAGDTDTFTNIDSARGTANADSFIGTTGRQDFTGHQGNDTFDGGAGVDRVDYLRSNYVGATTGVSVNLATGTATDSFGDTDMLMNIEDIRGTEFADTIIGDDEDNRLEGLYGDDSLVGGGGDDRLYGDDGSDSLFGGDGEDRLYGGADNDSLFGDEGKDWLEGGAGDDLLDGGAGNEDSATYFDDPAGVIGSLITGTVTDGFGGTDTLIGIERLRGSEHNDTLTGGGIDGLWLRGHGGDDVLTTDNAGSFSDLDAGDGDDTLVSLAGDVFFQPGAGNDSITGSSNPDDYSTIGYVYSAQDGNPAPTNGIVVVFSSEHSGTVTDFAGGTDTFTQIDGVEGTNLADSFAGAEGRQQFTGNMGDDTFDGGAGNDMVDYRTERFQDPAHGVSVDLALGTAIDSFGDTDTLTNIEEIRGTDFADTITGDGEDNYFEGRDGDDILDGAGGDDNLRGGQGNDTLLGGDGRDDLRGDEGDDILDGGDGDRDEARYDNDPGSVTANLTTGIATDGWGDADTLIGIEELRGSNFDDVLFGATGLQSELRGRGGDDSLTGADDEFETGLDGGSGNDTLDGGTGGAFMSPGSGNDVIIGGTEDEGFYSINYLWDAFDEGASSGITAVFSSERDGTITDFAGDTDTFTGIDRVQGTMFADSFTGTDGNQDFRGYGGDDFFDGGAGGGDRIDYSRPEDEFGTIGGVVVDMAAGTAIDPYGDTDTFINIERIRGTDFDDTMSGSAGDDRFDGRDGDDNLSGAAGNDTVSGEDGSDTLSGGEGEDDLRGGDGDDTLLGGAGNDQLAGGEGNDALDGGAGDFDRTTYYNTPGGVIGNLTTGIVTDGWGDTDTLTGIEEIHGGAFDDVLTGGTGFQTSLFGNDGNDSLTAVSDDFFTGLFGGSGNDTLTSGSSDVFMAPGSGSDTLVGNVFGAGFVNVGYDYDAFFDNAVTGLTVTYSAERDGTVLDYAGGTDTFTGIDMINGTMLADSFVGATGNQEFAGRGGNDTLDGGAGDRDVANYRNGQSFFGTLQGVIVDLSAGTATDEFGDTDTLIGIEGIQGSDMDDEITGDANGNLLLSNGGNDTVSGGGGNDTIDGGDGDDVLSAGAGNDLMVGGSGADIFIVSAGDEHVLITDFEIGIDTLDLSGFARADALAAIEGAQSGSAILTFGDGTVLTIEGNNVSPETLSLDDIELADEFITADQLINGDDTSEALTGGSGNDTINGMGGDDTLTGLAGNDVMSGGDGADSLDGGDGNDSLQGDDGDDVLRGGAGDDTLEGGAGDDTLENVFGGTDLWDGGAGADTLVTDVSAISPDAGQVLSVDLAAGTHGLQGSTAGQDTLISIENFIILGAWAAEIRGDDSDNDLRGDAGNDTILGLAGNDRLSDGAGNDSVEGGAGDDTIVAGSGMDTFNGGDGYDLIEVDLSGTANGAFTAVIDLDNGEIYALEFPESNPDTLIGLEAIHLFADVDAKLFGNSEDNDLRSGQGDDALSGLGGDDTLDGQGGDDTIDGGDGIDTALYSGDQASYTLTLTPNGTTLTDRRADGNGTDMLTDIELLNFDTDLFGTPFNLEEFGGPTGLSDTDFKSFIELYIAYFNRAPDAVGLNFWGTAFATGTTLEEMAALFEPQAETQAAYPPGTSNEEFATTVYNNVLGRVPDQDGLNFWVGVLDGGSVGRDTFILEVLRGVKAAPPEAASQEFIDQQMADAEYLANKTDIGAYFAVIKGMSDTDDASAAMAFFDGSESSISAAVTAIDGFYADALDPVDGGFLMPLVGVLDDPFATV